MPAFVEKAREHAPEARQMERNAAACHYERHCRDDQRKANALPDGEHFSEYGNSEHDGRHRVQCSQYGSRRGADVLYRACGA